MSRNWDTERADKCKLPELLPDICEKCRDKAYCDKHRYKQVTIDELVLCLPYQARLYGEEDRRRNGMIDKNKLLADLRYSSQYNTPCPEWVFKKIEAMEDEPCEDAIDRYAAHIDTDVYCADAERKKDDNTRTDSGSNR